MKKIIIIMISVFGLSTGSAIAANPYNSPCGGDFFLLERIDPEFIDARNWGEYLQCSKRERPALRSQAIIDGTLPIGCGRKLRAVESERHYQDRMRENQCQMLGQSDDVEVVIIEPVVVTPPKEEPKNEYHCWDGRKISYSMTSHKRYSSIMGMPKFDAVPKVQSKPKFKVQSKPKFKVQSKPKFKVQSKPKSKVQSKPKSKVQSKPKSKVKAKPKSNVKAKPKTKSQKNKQPSQTRVAVYSSVKNTAPKKSNSRKSQSRSNMR